MLESGVVFVLAFGVGFAVLGYFLLERRIRRLEALPVVVTQEPSAVDRALADMGAFEQEVLASVRRAQARGGAA